MNAPASNIRGLGTDGRRTAASTAGRTAPAPAWLQLTTLALSLAGLGVSLYLTITHYTTPTALACPDTGIVNCTKVTTSPQSMLFGVIPVALLGLLFYVFLTVVNSPRAWRGEPAGPAMGTAGLNGRRTDPGRRYRSVTCQTLIQTRATPEQVSSRDRSSRAGLRPSRTPASRQEAASGGRSAGRGGRRGGRHHHQPPGCAQRGQRGGGTGRRRGPRRTRSP